MKNDLSYFDGLPARLRQERVRLGFTQEALAEIGGVSKNTQYLNEQKCRAIDPDYYDRIAKAGIDIDFVLTGTRRENTTSVPEDLQPVVEALITLWLSRTVSVDTLNSWRTMFERMNPFMNPEAAKSVTPQQIVQDPAQSIKTDPTDLSFLSRKPGNR